MYILQMIFKNKNSIKKKKIKCVTLLMITSTVSNSRFNWSIDIYLSSDREKRFTG